MEAPTSLDGSEQYMVNFINDENTLGLTVPQSGDGSSPAQVFIDLAQFLVVEMIFVKKPCAQESEETINEIKSELTTQYTEEQNIQENQEIFEQFTQNQLKSEPSSMNGIESNFCEFSEEIVDYNDYEISQNDNLENYGNENMLNYPVQENNNNNNNNNNIENDTLNETSYTLTSYRLNENENMLNEHINNFEENSIDMNIKVKTTSHLSPILQNSHKLLENDPTFGDSYINANVKLEEPDKLSFDSDNVSTMHENIQNNAKCKSNDDELLNNEVLDNILEDFKEEEMEVEYLDEENLSFNSFSDNEVISQKTVVNDDAQDTTTTNNINTTQIEFEHYSHERINNLKENKSKAKSCSLIHQKTLDDDNTSNNTNSTSTSCHLTAESSRNSSQTTRNPRDRRSLLRTKRNQSKSSTEKRFKCICGSSYSNIYRLRYHKKKFGCVSSDEEESETEPSLNKKTLNQNQSSPIDYELNEQSAVTPSHSNKYDCNTKTSKIQPIISKKESCIQCKICRVTVSESNLAKHLESHAQKSNVTCNVCDMQFISSQKLQIHISQNHKNGKLLEKSNLVYHCFLCKLSQKTKSDHMLHLAHSKHLQLEEIWKKESNIAGFVCEYCTEETLKNFVEYAEHYQYNHSEFIYDQMEQIFSSVT